MADPFTIALVGMVALVVAIVLVVVYNTWRRKKEGRSSRTNYRAFFLMGLVWFPVGVALMAVSVVIGMPVLYALPLFALGLIYLIIGLWNRDKWEGGR